MGQNMIYLYMVYCVYKYTETRRSTDISLQPQSRSNIQGIRGKNKRKWKKTRTITRQEKKRGVYICLMIMLTIQSTQPDPTSGGERERERERDSICISRILVLDALGSFSFSGRLHFKVPIPTTTQKDFSTY